MVFMWIY